MKTFLQVLLLALLIIPQKGKGQTSPTPFDLSSGNWTLSGWNKKAPALSYPGNGATGTDSITGVVAGAASANMVFWKHAAADPSVSTIPNSDYDTIYNQSSGTRLTGKDASGFSFINTGAVGRLGSACLSLKTTGRSNIVVAWTGRTIALGGRPYLIRLQYRVGTLGAFTDAGGTFIYTPGGAVNTSSNIVSVLPSGADNQAVVQVLWRYYQDTGTASGTRPELGVDDITVSSSVICTPPTQVTTSFTASSVSTTTASLGWTSGNGTGRVLFLKEGSFSGILPFSNTTYTANSDYSASSTAFDGGKTVYNGTGSSVAVTGLTPNTLYNAKVFEYLGAGGSECYNIAALSGNFTTVSNPPLTNAASALSTQGFTANWAAPAGNGAAPVTYTLDVATDNAFSSIIYTRSNLTTTSAAVGSLTPATTYYYRVWTVNAGGTSAASNTITVTTLPDSPPTPTVGAQNCGSTTLPAYTGPQASSYYWQGTNATGTSQSLPATADYSATISGNYYVRAFVNGQWSAATSAAVTVFQNPAIAAQPAGTSTPAGGNATFTATVTDPGNYQWQENSGTGWANLTNGGVYSGATTATLTLTGVTQYMNGFQYRIKTDAVSPCATTVTSNAAALTVTPVSAATDYFRSRANGLYGAVSTWESSADSLTWINATLEPTSAAHSVTIRVSDSVTVQDSGKSAAYLYIFGKLTLSGQNLAVVDRSGYDAVIFNGGRLDCGSNQAGNSLNLATNATTLVKTGGRITTRINKSLDGPGRSSDYFFEDKSILEYATSQGLSISMSNIVYFPNSSPSVSPIFLFSRSITGNLGADNPTTFKGVVEIAPNVSVFFTQGNGQKFFRDGLIVNGSLVANNNTPIIISGTNAILKGAGTITLGSVGGMNINSSAKAELQSDIIVNSTGGTFTIEGTLNTNGYVLSGTADLVTATGSSLVITDAAGIRATGANSGNIQTTGTRSFSPTGKYVYGGTGAQVTGDGLPATSTSLEINNPAGVTLSSNHTTAATLKLISGNLSTSAANLLTLGDTATVTGGGASSYINGPLRRTTSATTSFVFPVGKSGHYAPVIITPQSNTSSDYTAEYFSGNGLTPNRQAKAPTLKAVAANEYFEISRGSGADAKITLAYTSAAGVTDPNSLVVAHYKGSQWESEGQSAVSGTNASGTVASNVVSSFSPFALGSTSAAQPLPLQLLSFEGRSGVNTVFLEWELADTDGNEQVLVERSSDGTSFSVLRSLPVAKSARLRQQFTDEAPLQGRSMYYRLRIRSAFGSEQFSRVLPVRLETAGTNWRLYPNPAKTVLHLDGPDPTLPVQIYFYNTTGQFIASEKVSAQMAHCIPINERPEGFYWIVVEQADRIERFQIQIAR